MTKENSSNQSMPEKSDQSAADIPPIDPRQELLALPAISESTGTTKMDMSGGSASVMLDHLGPIVVGTDGSLSRIANYEKMSELEKKNTLRIISKRNKERLAALKVNKDDNEISK
ncbi:hypothetical protein HI914_01499 [Erysiphe necator]|nr:hypothetical protein HI914_01499 [Erysiphe necator]